MARFVPLQPGEPLHLADVRAAIKRLYGTGEYSNIEIDTEPAASGIELIIRTTESWFVGPVEIRGKVSLPPSEAQLATAARLELGAPFDEQDLPTAQAGIRSLLQRNGLYLAKVEPKIERDSEHQQVSFTFQVDSGKRARLNAPTITGDPGIPEDQVAKSAKYKGWFRWKPATDETTQAGIANIRNHYDKKDRLIAAVTLDHMDYDAAANQVHPTIKADGGPKIDIQARGAKVSKGNLKTYVPIWDEGTVNTDLLVSGVRNLRDYFQNRGYFDVQVDYQTSEVSPDERKITYVIGLGDRHKVVAVDIKGNRYFITPEIRERMFLQPKGSIRLRHGRYSEGLSRRDQESIKALYLDNGFRDVKVTITPIDNFKGVKGDVSITVAIDEGRQYKVASLTINGMTRPDKDSFTARLASVAGQPFSETAVATDRDYILGIYQSGGYPDSNFESRVANGPGPDQVTLQYNITEGQPRYVRDVLLTGMHTTRHRLVDPNILLKPGDPLSWTEMGLIERRLSDLGVFDKVDMAIQNPNGDNQDKFVLYNFTEGRRYSLAVGAGAEIARIGGSQTSLDNPAGATGFAPRGDLEISRLNLWGLGHSLNFKGRYSTLDRRVSLSYLAPISQRRRTKHHLHLPL